MDTTTDTTDADALRNKTIDRLRAQVIHATKGVRLDWVAEALISVLGYAIAENTADQHEKDQNDISVTEGVRRMLFNEIRASRAWIAKYKAEQEQAP